MTSSTTSKKTVSVDKQLQLPDNKRLRTSKCYTFLFLLETLVLAAGNLKLFALHSSSTEKLCTECISPDCMHRSMKRKTKVVMRKSLRSVLTLEMSKRHSTDIGVGGSFSSTASTWAVYTDIGSAFHFGQSFSFVIHSGP